RTGAQVHGDAALLEGAGQLLGGVGVLGRDQAVQHLADRDLAAEVVQDRGELDANHAAAEDRGPGGHRVDFEQAGRVDAERAVDAVDRGGGGGGGGAGA